MEAVWFVIAIPGNLDDVQIMNLNTNEMATGNFKVPLVSIRIILKQYIIRSIATNFVLTEIVVIHVKQLIFITHGNPKV